MLTGSRLANWGGGGGGGGGGGLLTIAPSNVDLTLRPLKHRSVLGNFQLGERLERPVGLRKGCQAADTEHVRSIGQVAKKCLAFALEEKGHASCRDHGWTTDGPRTGTDHEAPVHLAYFLQGQDLGNLAMASRYDARTPSHRLGSALDGPVLIGGTRVSLLFGVVRASPAFGRDLPTGHLHAGVASDDK